MGQFSVLVAAPTRRDGEITVDLLGKAGIDCIAFRGIGKIADQLTLDVGAIVLTDLVLAEPAFGNFVEAMRQQPAWSDIPVLLLTRERVRLPMQGGVLASLSNVTLLDRPSSTRSMVSAVEAALRARERQYELRDQLKAQHEAEAALRDADMRKDEFLATLAHELRNPLAAIRTGLAVLDRSHGEPERTARIVGMIDRQSRMLAKLIDDLLDVSRIATGKVVIEEHVIDLRAVLELGLEAGQTIFDASRHDFRLELPPSPVLIRGDSARLAQVVGNLVNNAGKYTPDGGSVTVRLTQEASEAVLRVIDTGVGIPAEQLDRVFEMFAQVDGTLDRSGGGLGIGLSLVRRLVELHGGTVSAQSGGAGAGSVFTIRLPIAVERSENDDLDVAAPASQATRLLKILVVDDNKDLADALSALLRGNGHDVRTAYDGPTAVEQAALFEPDIVFCDIGMPGMNGHEVARTLRSRSTSKTPLLVAVTGWGNPQDRRQALEAGFDLHQTKPISTDHVAAILAKGMRTD